MTVQILPPSDRARWTEEWVAELDAMSSEGPMPPLLAPLGWSVSLFLRAVTMRSLLAHQARVRAIPKGAHRVRLLSSARARQLAIRRLRMRRMIVGLWMTCLAGAMAGIPFATAGVEMGTRLLTQMQEADKGGIETSETHRSLLDERSRMRRR